MKRNLLYEEEVYKIIKEERKLKSINREDYMISFDSYQISSFDAKWYISEPDFNRKKKEIIYSNFYELNIQLYPKRRYSEFGAYNADGNLILILYVWYSQSVQERYLTKKNKNSFSVRCVKD